MKRRYPAFAIESGWSDVINETYHDKTSTFWIQYEDANTTATVSDTGIECCSSSSSSSSSSNNSWTAVVNDKYSLHVSHNNVTAILYTPFREVSLPRNHAWYCMDISPSGGLGLVGGSDGQLKIWDPLHGDIRRSLDGHVGDVYTARFFPSSEVVLSGGSGMQLMIHHAIEGYLAATLTGHKRGILDTAMIDRGRNIISCSRDGTVRLWDCGTQQQIRLLYDSSSDREDFISVNAMSLNMNGDLTAACEVSATVASSVEVGTTGQLVALASDDGFIRGISVRAGKEIFSMKLTQPTVAPVTAVSFVSEYDLVCGDSSGGIYLYDIRYQTKPRTYSRILGGAEVTTIMSNNTPDSFTVGSSDGSCVIMDWSTGNSCSTDKLLCSGDLNPIYSIKHRGNSIWSLSRDRRMCCFDGLIF